jgi:hypothetical protein
MFYGTFRTILVQIGQVMSEEKIFFNFTDENNGHQAMAKAHKFE